MFVIYSCIKRGIGVGNPKDEMLAYANLFFFDFVAYIANKLYNIFIIRNKGMGFI